MRWRMVGVTIGHIHRPKSAVHHMFIGPRLCRPIPSPTRLRGNRDASLMIRTVNRFVRSRSSLEFMLTSFHSGKQAA